MKKSLLATAVLLSSVLSSTLFAEESQPMTQEDFNWQDMQLETTYTTGAFNRILRKITTITKITNNQSVTLEGDIYRYIISDPNLQPFSVGCENQELINLTNSTDKFFYLPINSLAPGETVSCQINFELKRNRLNYTPIIQEGTWIDIGAAPQEDFTWFHTEDSEFEIHNTALEFNSDRQRLTSTTTVVNTSDFEQTWDAYRYKIDTVAYGRTPEFAYCEGQELEIIQNLYHADMFFFIPLQNIQPGESISCEIDFSLEDTSGRPQSEFYYIGNIEKGLYSPSQY